VNFDFWFKFKQKACIFVVEFIIKPPEQPMKIWQKESTQTSEKIETFTVGLDKIMDLELGVFDTIGSMAHIIMLESVGLLQRDELAVLLTELKKIHDDLQTNKLEKLDDDVEDIHSHIEWILTQRLGDVGKKIHSGRSRNDQVLVDMKLYLRAKVEETVGNTTQLFKTLIRLSELHKNDLLPGYTHLQIAMPSSFGLWFGAYAESLIDDLTVLQGAFKVINKNPLGSGAGYGSSFPLDRQLTTQLLGFDDLNVNVVYAQMTRGKTEQILANALSIIASTLSRLAMDVCLYNSQNFGFILLPDDFTTGSSIMPHKKNPDVAELLRAKCNRIKTLPTEIAFVMSNLPSGYHRDMQLIKEIVMPAINELNECLEMTNFMLENIRIKANLLADEKYDLLFSVERVNQLVLEGIPFRDAYKIVGKEIETGTYVAPRELNHSLEGSIGNLQNEHIEKSMQAVLNDFNFEKINDSIKNLLNFRI
jgi:argininosuccinate lyase